jgi:hypothetical protein
MVSEAEPLAPPKDKSVLFAHISNKAGVLILKKSHKRGRNEV